MYELTLQHFFDSEFHPSKVKHRLKPLQIVCNNI